MPSVNKIKKEIEKLKDKVTVQKIDRNWKHENPHWKYDIMFCNWYLYETYKDVDWNDLTDKERFHLEISELKPFNEEDLKECLNYFETNHINPFEDGYIECFLMFVCPDYFDSNKIPDSFYELWDKFLKTHNFSVFVQEV